MKYKAIICDVDGTLVVSNPDALPSARVTAAVRKAQKKVHVGIATGRCFPHSSNIIDLLNISDPCILQGGGLIYNPKTKQTISEYVFTDNELNTLQNILKDAHTPFLYCDNTTKNHDTFPLDKKIARKTFMVFGTLETDTAHKLSRYISENSQMAAHIVNSWTPGKSDLLITNPYATKQHGVLEIAKILNISTDEIIGIGDGGNDFPLLMACGLKVAMGNANDDLKAIADYVAPPVEDDGVAHVIEKFILNT